MKVRVFLLMVVMSLLAGCANYKQEIWLRPDGSAQIYSEIGIERSQIPGQLPTHPLEEGFNRADPNVISADFGMNEENGYQTYYATVAVKNFADFLATGKFAATLLTEETNAAGNRVLTIKSAADPQFTTLLARQPRQANLVGQDVTILIHAPAIIKTNGAVIAQDKAGATAQWQMPMSEVLAQINQLAFTVEYDLTAPTTLPTATAIPDEATPVATPKAANSASNQAASTTNNSTVTTVRNTPEAGLDSDGDWVSAADEERYGSNPTAVDSDQDGLTDFEEIFIFATNPAAAEPDADQDGFADVIEENFFKTDPASKDEDRDGDLLPDLAELELRTDADLVDTDGDLLADFIELFLLQSDPGEADADSDADGYADPLESWLPDELADTVCAVDITLFPTALTVHDAEEADGASIVGGDEILFLYGVIVSRDGEYYGVTADNTANDPNYRASVQLWQGETFPGDEVTQFTALETVPARCGYPVVHLLQLVEDDSPWGGRTDMGALDKSQTLLVQRIPLGWGWSVETSHHFEGTGIDGSFDYEAVFTFVVNPEQPAFAPAVTSARTTTASVAAVVNAPAAIDATEYDTAQLQVIAANPPTFVDDFSQNDGRWREVTEGDLVTAFQNGAYQLTAQKVSTGAWVSADVELADFLMEVDMVAPHSASEPYSGVMFRFIDEGNFYLFYISTQGNYLVVKFVDNEFVAIVEPTYSSAIHVGEGAWNRLSIMAIGSQIQLAVNGTLIHEFEDESLQRGDLALTLEVSAEAGVTATYDNFKFWNLRQLPPEARLAVTGQELSDLSLQELLKLGDEYYWFHDLKDHAFTVYDYAIQNNQKSEAAYVGRGHIYRLQDKYDLAMKDFEQALKLNPNYAPAYRGIGAVYDAQEDPFTALENINKAIALDPNYSLAYYYRGLIYWGQGSTDAALADYSKAIEIDPTNSELYYNRGRFYAAQENRFAALADFNKAIELYSQDASYYAERAAMYNHQEEYYLALADYNKAIALSPLNAIYYAKRGHVFYDNLKEHQLAWVNYDQVIQRDQNYADGYYFRGDAYVELKNYRAAVTDYEKALQLSPTFALPYYKRAVAYEALGDQQKAYADYLKYLDLDKTDNYATREACSQVNWLHFALSSNALAAIVNALAQPCNRFPTELANQPYSSRDQGSSGTCSCTTREVFDYNDLLGNPVTRIEHFCYQNGVPVANC